MRASKDYVVRDVAGEVLLIPTGEAAVRFGGMFTLNELGRFLFDALAEETTLDALVGKVTSEYDVDAETARADALEFLQALRTYGALVE